MMNVVMLNATSPRGLLVTLNPAQLNKMFDWLKLKHAPPDELMFVVSVMLSFIEAQPMLALYVVKLETLKMNVLLA